MLPCVRQEHFTYTQVSVVWLCAKIPKGHAFTSSPIMEVACVSSAVVSREISRLDGVGSVDYFVRMVLIKCLLISSCCSCDFRSCLNVEVSLRHLALPTALIS